MKSVKSNAILNTLKTICSTIFPLITVPYATRILKAYNYGKVGTSNSIISYFLLIAMLGIVTYAQREGPAIRDSKEKFTMFASELFSINVYATIVSYICLFVLIYLSNKLKSYKPLLFIQSIQIILTTIGADWINTIYEDYFYVTIRYIIVQCVSLLLLFLFVRTPRDYLIYALIMSLATTGGNIFNVFYIRRYCKLRLLSLKKCSKHIKPIMKLFAVNITMTVYVSSDITILGLLIGNKDAGIYQLSAKIYTMIKQMLVAVFSVAMPRLSYYLGVENDESYINLLKNIFRSIVTLVFPLMAGLFILSPKLLMILGGKEFIIGDLSLKILSLATFASLFSYFFANCILVLFRKDNIFLIATMASACINVTLNFILIPIFSYNGAALTTLLAEIIMLFIVIYNSMNIELIQKNIKSIFYDLRVFISSLIGCVFIVIICVFLDKLIVAPLINVLVSFVISSIGFVIIEIILKNQFVINSIESIKRKFKIKKQD